MDEAFNDFKRTNNFFLDTGKIIYNLCLGMVEGLKEMLTIPEISAQTAVLIAELGVGITAVTLLAPEVILPILHALASTVGVFFSAYMACVSAGNMYYTATREADRYEKAKAFGRDGINLIVNVFALKFEVPAAIKDSKKVYNVLSELRHNGYSSLKNPVRLGIISITNLDDFLEVIKGKVSTDAEEYLKRVFSTYDDKMVKDTATVIERAYSHTQTPLNQKSAEKIIDLITHNETGSLDDVVELFKAWAGAGCRSFDEMLAFLNGKADADAISYLKNVRDIYGETLAENAATVVEKAYASCQKPLGKEGIVKIVDALNSSEGKVLDEVADEVADWMIKANQVQELLRRVKGKVDDVAYRYLETAFETQNISMSEEIVITIEKVYDSVKKPLNKENAEKLIGMLANKQGKTLDDVAEEMVQVIKGGNNSWVRNLDNTNDLNIDDFLSLKDNGVVKVNTSGSNRPLTGAPNSYYKTGNGEHIFVYDGDGKLIYDISSSRVKGFKINVDPNGVEHYQCIQTRRCCARCN